MLKRPLSRCLSRIGLRLRERARVSTSPLRYESRSLQASVPKEASRPTCRSIRSLSSTRLARFLVVSTARTSTGSGKETFRAPCPSNHDQPLLPLPASWVKRQASFMSSASSKPEIKLPMCTVLEGVHYIPVALDLAPERHSAPDPEMAREAILATI